jgi:hypothetical protein
LLYLSILHFAGEAIGTRPLLLFGGLFVLSGLQIFFSGFLADLLAHFSSKKDKTFLLKYSSEK